LYEVLLCLNSGIVINVERHNLSLRISLRKHKRNKTATRAKVKDTTIMLDICPGTEQHAISAHLHGTELVGDRKLLKTKHLA
jgi:hypothetical protein